MKVLLRVFMVVSILHTSYFILHTPTVYAQPSCDRCGYCVGNDIPQDYYSCVSCVYDVDLDESVAPPAPIDAPAVAGKNWTVISCISTDPAEFTQTILRFVTTIAGGIIFIVLLYGSFLVLTSAGDPQQLGRGKSMIKSGIIALILIIFSVFILQFIGFELLRIPGFG